MAAFPQEVISTDQLDEGTDNPSLARPDLLRAIQVVNQIMASADDVEGIPVLDENGLIKAAQLLKDLPGGVPSLDENTRLSGFRLPVGPGLGVDADSEEIRIERGLEEDQDTVIIENSGSAFIQTLVIDKSGLIIRAESGIAPTLSEQLFTSYFSTEQQAIDAIPANGLYTGTQTRQVQSGTTQQCTTSTGKNPITTCTNVPRYVTQYRAVYLTQ